MGGTGDATRQVHTMHRKLLHLLSHPELLHNASDWQHRLDAGMDPFLTGDGVRVCVFFFMFICSLLRAISFYTALQILLEVGVLRATLILEFVSVWRFILVGYGYRKAMGGRCVIECKA